MEINAGAIEDDHADIFVTVKKAPRIDTCDVEIDPRGNVLEEHPHASRDTGRMGGDFLRPIGDKMEDRVLE